MVIVLTCFNLYDYSQLFNLPMLNLVFTDFKSISRANSWVQCFLSRGHFFWDPWRLHKNRKLIWLLFQDGYDEIRRWPTHTNVGKTIINHPFGNGLYNQFMVIWEMVYYCFTHTTNYRLKPYTSVYYSLNSPTPLRKKTQIDTFFNCREKQFHAGQVMWNFGNNMGTVQTLNLRGWVWGLIQCRFSKHFEQKLYVPKDCRSRQGAGKKNEVMFLLR